MQNRNIAPAAGSQAPSSPLSEHQLLTQIARFDSDCFEAVLDCLRANSVCEDAITALARLAQAKAPDIDPVAPIEIAAAFDLSALADALKSNAR